MKSIVSIALHLADVAGKANHLVAVAELIVVPQIQDNGLSIFADLGGRSVEDAGAAVADAVAGDELGVVAETDLLDKVAFKAGDTEGLVATALQRPLQTWLPSIPSAILWWAGR